MYLRLATPESIRRSNLSLVLRRLHEAGPMSRSELGSKLGMTRSTIGLLVADLAARGLVLEEGAARLGSPGRPSQVVHPNPAGLAVITAEVAVDSLAVGVVGLGGEFLGRLRTEHQPKRLSVEQTINDVGEMVRAVRRSLPTRALLAGVGIAIYGVVRRADGLVHFAPNLGWRDIPLGTLISNQLSDGLPITIGNDADLGALAEHARGAGVGIDHLLYLSSEVGVGGGLIIDGRPLVGASGCAGEIGHIQVNPAGVQCRCGAIGCWETEIGELALLRRAGRAQGAHRAAAVAAVLKDAARGEPTARAATEAVGHWLGSGIAGLVNTFNPRRVVLGGFLAALHPLVEEIVAQEMRVRTMAPAREVVDIRPAKLGSDAALLGAAELALAPFLDDPGIIPIRRAQAASA
jgi:predicted NBD/HSP70 family sugar kinase